MAADSKPDSAGSALVRELSERMLSAENEKVATTLRLTRRTLKRLKAQEQKWGTPMSFITERALVPVLDELERAEVPATDGSAADG